MSRRITFDEPVSRPASAASAPYANGNGGGTLPRNGYHRSSAASDTSSAAGFRSADYGGPRAFNRANAFEHTDRTCCGFLPSR